MVIQPTSYGSTVVPPGAESGGLIWPLMLAGAVIVVAVIVLAFKAWSRYAKQSGLRQKW